MNYILSDGHYRDAMLPFTFTRPIADIRIGILTIREKWERYLSTEVTTMSSAYLSEKFPLKTAAENVVINAPFLPSQDLVEKIHALRLGEALVTEGEIIAYCTENPEAAFSLSSYRSIAFKNAVVTVKNPWDIFSKNGKVLQADFELLTRGRESHPISSTNTVIAPEHIFIEEGATVACSILNASTGPIYIGKGAEIMEGCVIRGGLALCDHAILKMGAKIYGPSTFGPHCRIGGEVNNTVAFGYSNKGHEGFLGNSVLGEWCNLGADTNTSNMKNNYAEVRLWSYGTEGFARTGLQFCGLMMGDHSKCGINTMFNTGTVVGVSANIFGSGYPRNFIPSFSWGGASGFTSYLPKRALETAKTMMARRGLVLDSKERAILEEVYELTKKWRRT
ncbi:MAG: GlmU family protein [Bacteroidota bacterium]